MSFFLLLCRTRCLFFQQFKFSHNFHFPVKSTLHRQHVPALLSNLLQASFNRSAGKNAKSPFTGLLRRDRSDKILQSQNKSSGPYLKSGLQ
jgi:hypothetical protein